MTSLFSKARLKVYTKTTFIVQNYLHDKDEITFLTFCKVGNSTLFFRSRNFYYYYFFSRGSWVRGSELWLRCCGTSYSNCNGCFTFNEKIIIYITFLMSEILQRLVQATTLQRVYFASWEATTVASFIATIVDTFSWNTWRKVSSFCFSWSVTLSSSLSPLPPDSMLHDNFFWALWEGNQHWRKEKDTSVPTNVTTIVG